MLSTAPEFVLYKPLLNASGMALDPSHIGLKFCRAAKQGEQSMLIHGTDAL